MSLKIITHNEYLNDIFKKYGNFIFLFILSLFFILFCIQIHKYLKKEEERKKLIFEIEDFQNQIFDKSNHTKNYVLKDDDIFELITNPDSNFYMTF
jgi:hypothetical protein